MSDEPTVTTDVIVRLTLTDYGLAGTELLTITAAHISIAPLPAPYGAPLDAEVVAVALRKAADACDRGTLEVDEVRW